MRPGRLYWPKVLDRVCRRNPVTALTAVTEAPTIAAPVESVMLPEIVAVPSWAFRGCQTNTRHKTNTLEIGRVILPPVTRLLDEILALVPFPANGSLQKSSIFKFANASLLFPSELAPETSGGVNNKILFVDRQRLVSKTICGKIRKTFSKLRPLTLRSGERFRCGKAHFR